jgi:hypothetical protein
VDNDRTVVGADNSDLVEVAGTIASDEHRHSLVEVLDEYGVVEGMRMVSSLTPCFLALCTILGCVTSYLASSATAR